VTLEEQRALLAKHREMGRLELAKDIERACQTGFTEHLDAIEGKRIYLDRLERLDQDLPHLNALVAPPFVREATCPRHDSRCTEDLCVLDPRHPIHAAIA